MDPSLLPTGLPKLRPLRVLIVEDDLDTAASMALLLGLDGYTVDTARDGPTSLELARAGTPDVVLLDIGLPKMDGYALAEELSRLHEPPIIIAISGYEKASDRRGSAHGGITFYFLKPVRPDLLLRVLKTLQEQRDRAPQPAGIAPMLSSAGAAQMRLPSQGSG